MIGFSNKSLLLALLLSASTAAFAAPGGAPRDTGPGFEQDGSMDVNTNGDQQPEQGEQAPVAVEPRDAVIAVEPRDTAISETAVSAPPLDGFGTLEPGNGGLPSDIWRGSTRDSADPLLKEIHSGVANDALRDLLTQLLLTQASPPQGQGQQGWFGLRLNALIAIGADDKAEQMVASLPASMMDASMAELRVNLMLARGEYDKACEKAQPGNLPADDSDDYFWHKLGILCLANEGKQDEASVGMDLMREERHTDDAFFQEAIRRIGDKSSPIRATPKRWTILNVALLRLSGDYEKLKNNMDSLPPVTLKYIAQDGSLDTKIREHAAARAEAIGVLPGGEGRTTEQPFGRPLASDVTTLVSALGSGKEPNEDDNALIARLALDDAGLTDGRRVERLLTLMEPFGYRVPPDVWDKLLIHRERYDGELPPAALIARLNDAVAGGRRGEVILLAALIADGSDAQRDSDLVLLPVIKGLIAAGFEHQARELAHAAVKGYSAR